MFEDEDQEVLRAHMREIVTTGIPVSSNVVTLATPDRSEMTTYQCLLVLMGGEFSAYEGLLALLMHVEQHRVQQGISLEEVQQATASVRRRMAEELGRRN